VIPALFSGPLLRALFVFAGALPWWIPIARGHLDLGVLGTALDRVFVPMCHRLAERSLVLAGVQMPVCSRCAGIFAGFAVGAVIARPRLSMKVWRPVLIALGVIMTADVVTQDLGLHPVWHPVRLATGFALGFAMVVSFVTHVMDGLTDRRHPAGRP
jgi:uncharacterized membrane protein